MAAVASASPIPTHPYPLETHRRPSRIALRTAVSRAQTRQSPRDRDLRHAYLRPSDSSDDEELAPIKLSAEAQAILGEGNPQAQSDKENIDPNRHDARESDLQRSVAPQIQPIQHCDGSPAQRAHRPAPPTVLERDGSFAYKVIDKTKTYGLLGTDSKTPAPRLRKVRVSGSRSQTRSPTSAGAAIIEHNSALEDYRSPDEGDHRSSPEEEREEHGPYTIARPRKVKETGAHSTVRAQKTGTNTLLRGHVRRGLIRRQSEDEESHEPCRESGSYSPEMQMGRRAEIELDNKPDDLLIDYDSPKPRRKPSPAVQNQHDAVQRTASPSAPQELRDTSPPRPISFSASIGRQHPTPAISSGAASSRSSSSRRPVFKIPSLPPVESAHDQENEPPPTFRRTKPTAAQLEIHDEEEELAGRKQQRQNSPKESPSRQPLMARSNNTPHRPAPPPPPKMSLVEAATSNAGNSRAKKSVHYVLNARTYRRLDCIGRGGSSRVFRIMAENYKIFALKRVNLEEADMAAIAGYKGEIELLKKLENVERVIRLFDYEVNEEKGVLSVMMELGETDFNKMLNEQLKNDNAKLDITFTRHYWKEMLECVQAVHEHDIVHSDLKPANFLLVKGQLKLIDFGIANAIQDNTVNVHRENQIGTPNYMSPESLVCHAPVAGQAVGTKLLKLGKPSDVWSLGCILYQMTYGQPPFAHIQKQFERIMSIPNPKVEIQFPSTGIGGSVVPFGLIKTLKRCLQRDQTLRPTIKELLSDADPFLNPVAISPDMLGRVIGNVVSYCRKREESYRQSGELGQEGKSCLPRDEEMRGWPLAFYDKLKQAQEEGTAW